MLSNLLDAVGDKGGVIVAGFFGGVARIGFFGVGESGPVAAVFALIGGTATAVYLGPLGPSYMGWPPSGQATLAATFIIGVFGMEILRRIGTRITNWIPDVATSKTGDKSK